LNLIIVGAGSVGYSLAEHLSKQGHHISIIEKDTSLYNAINSNLDVFVLNDVGTNPLALENAGISTADMIIAVTPHNDTNLVVCNFAMQYNVPQRIARINSAEYTQAHSSISLEKIGVSHVIEPEKEVVRHILQYIEFPGVTESANFQSDSVLLRGYKITDTMPIANRSLQEIHEANEAADILIVLVVRGGKGVMPSGSTRILPGDEIIGIMPAHSLNTFRTLVGRHNSSKREKVIVFGDTRTTLHLVRALKSRAERVILVDPDEQHGQEAASQLDGVEVMYGDCTRVEMLQEVHVENASFFIGISSDTEDNIMSCLLAKAEGANEVVAVSNTRRHLGLFRSLGLDHIISPHIITTQSIIADVLKVSFGTLMTLKNMDVEVIHSVAEKKVR
jgi:trk system potassium uptake protein TrkA